MDDNPMPKPNQCKAHSKRTGDRCQAHAVAGWKVCRMHGAGGGAPRGQRHGQYKHGGYSLETKALLKQFRALAKISRQMLADIGA